MNTRIFFAMVISLLATSSLHAENSEQPEWIFRMGIHPFQPKENSHTAVHLDDTAAATFDATYLLTPHWGVELFGTAPMTHEMRLPNGNKVAEAREMPMTVSLQYHLLDRTGRARAYAGGGLAFATFFREKTSGLYAGQDLALHQSEGLAAVIGLDLDLGNDWFINTDARWFDIDTRATLNGNPFGTIQIDPFAFGLALGHRF